MIRRSDTVWEIPPDGGMRVPGLVFASEALLAGSDVARTLQQVRNVAHLPGIVVASMAMPDIHWGYGFPIGGVAATDVDGGGVVSPGGVGFDICCGVRLLASQLTESDFADRRDQVMAELDGRIPRGLGRGAIASRAVVDAVLAGGAPAAVAAGFGSEADLARIEGGGVDPGADVGKLSSHARERGYGQLGSLGAGNHFLEVQVVESVLDAAAADAFGLAAGMVCVMIHTGSRGLGHQTCTDHLAVMGPAMREHDITVPDRQLACVPVRSAAGAAYLAAMAAASNYAWANRQVLAHEARRSFAAAFGPEMLAAMPVVYDVAHNLAQVETHVVAGATRSLCVHRKGATRALAPGHPELAEPLRPFGQPVLLPGTMGTASWVLRGVAGNPAFDSAAHGAGRVLSRHAAGRRQSGRAVMTGLEGRGIAVRPGSVRLLAEEAPYAYKDVDMVADVCEDAQLAAKVARLRPLGVVKG